MRLLLAMAAVLSLAGCSCFDTAYGNWCADAGKCDAGSGGGGGGSAGGAGGGGGGSGDAGPQLHLALSFQSGGTAEVGSCTPIDLELRDETEAQVLAPHQMVIPLSVDPPGSAVFHNSPGCLSSVNEAVMQSSMGNVTVYFQPSQFGALTVFAASTEAMGAQGDFTASVEARLTVPTLTVTTNLCDPTAATFTVKAVAVGRPELAPTAAQPVLMAVQTSAAFAVLPQSGAGTCSGNETFAFAKGQGSFDVHVNLTAGAPLIGLASVRELDGVYDVVRNLAYLNLGNACRPPSTGCTVAGDCCATTNGGCVSQKCCAGQGDPCTDDADCCATTGLKCEGLSAQVPGSCVMP